MTVETQVGTFRIRSGEKPTAQKNVPWLPAPITARETALGGKILIGYYWFARAGGVGSADLSALKDPGIGAKTLITVSLSTLPWPR
jgi:hypothetical protein